VKALSLRQPFAWAVIHGGKDVENRSWHCHFRGPVLIHAARHWHALSPEALSRQMGIAVPEGLPRGGIIGRVEIVDCVNRSDSPWFTGPYGFLLCNPIPLPFTPCRGHLGFYDVEPEILEALGLSEVPCPNGKDV
jgi:hypothetical protein